jgi:hypothetical protein
MEQQVTYRQAVKDIARMFDMPTVIGLNSDLFPMSLDKYKRCKAEAADMVLKQKYDAQHDHLPF